MNLGPLGSLFGGVSASKYRDDQGAALNQLGAIGANYGSLYNTAQNDYNTWNPRATTATNSLADLLGRNTGQGWMDQQVGNATRNVGSSYSQGASNLTSRLASMGGNTGVMAGSLAGLEGSRQNALANASNAASLAAQNRNMQNASALQQLLSGQSALAYGRGVSALGSRAGIENQLFSGYGDMAQADEARQAQNASMLGSLITGGAALASGGGLSGLAGMFGRRKPPDGTGSGGGPVNGPGAVVGTGLGIGAGAGLGGGIGNAFGAGAINGALYPPGYYNYNYNYSDDPDRDPY